MEEVPGSERFFPAQLVFLALGFLGPESELIKTIGLKTDPRSNIETPKKVSPIRKALFWHYLNVSTEIFHQRSGRVCGR